MEFINNPLTMEEELLNLTSVALDAAAADGGSKEGCCTVL